jgi:hypothetical protein
MSLILCTSDCIYQRQGECTLDRAVSAGQKKFDRENCAYYIKKSKPKKIFQ